MVKTLTLDLSSRNLGWACDTGRNQPAYGLVLLPGIKSLGKLYAACRNAIETLIEEQKPDRILFCMALFHHAQTAARALAGVQAMAELCAYDAEIECLEANEPRARKMVLGRGSFGGVDPVTGSLIPGLGSKQAKAAVMEWCRERGYDEGRPWFGHDVGDALVLLEYSRMLQNGATHDAKPKGKRQIERLQGGG